VLTNSTVYGIDSYRASFYKPPIVAARLAGETGAIAGMVNIQQAESFLPPEVIIRSPSNGSSLNSGSVELSVSVVDQRRPIRSVRVLVNGRQVGGDDLKSLSGSRGLTVESAGLSVSGDENRVDFRFPLNLTGGGNRIEVIAANGYSEGKDFVEVNWQNARQSDVILPNLWILAIGVNRYDEPGINNLDYSVADARGIIDAFKSQEGRVFRRVNSLLIADGSATPPTAENIRDNLSYLRQAGQRDVVLLFIAGHGVNDANGNFLFLPSDAAFAADGTVRSSRAISNREIYSVLDVPGQKLVFIDSCHSEGVSGKKTRAVDNNQLVRGLMDNSTVIFTSSRGSELSQESREFGHGIFTYTIIQGMKGDADLIRDGKITMKELDTYVSETVPSLTGGAQHPTTTTPDGYINFNVAQR
jgi:hypothetical protein